MLHWYRQAHDFLLSVFTEVKRVEWPKRGEVVFNVIIVFILALIFSIFFLVVDQMIIYALRLGLGYGYD
ncbi:preprotein translocase subunit SecE [Holospora curviuscula]|uniref:Protein translocase subunit SecE n=1 Tax=Holospora curviuscula TaxID=1082868 RepID=A0A2S5R9H4_9PROT|nr:preprotein translocase subunit SecE [Holospora curviuscula]PPE03976.1 preprotein translocase subunit SecE [Holospora curviuscula]